MCELMHREEVLGRGFFVIGVDVLRIIELCIRSFILTGVGYLIFF